MTQPATSQSQQQPQSQHFLLKWNNHRSNLVTVFENLLQGENLVDVTLAVEGKFLKAHKIVLSACSPYFQSMFVHQTPGEKHPILIFHDLKFTHLKTLLEFMYRGEISIDEKDLSEILKVAEALSIRGLSSFESDDEDSNSEPTKSNSSSTPPSQNPNSNSTQPDQSPGNGPSSNPSSAPVTQHQSQSSGSNDNQTFYRQQNVCDSNGRRSPAASTTTGTGRGKAKVKAPVKVNIDESTGLPIKRKRGRQPKAATTANQANLVNLKPPVLKREVDVKIKGSGVPIKQGVRRRMPRKYSSPASQPQVKREKLSTDDVDDLDAEFLADDASLEILNSEPLSEMSVRGLDLFKYASIEDGVYRCMECEKLRIPKTFKNKYSFQRHAFLYHEGNMRKVFPCPVCSREFSRPDKMKNHLKSVHQGGNGKPSSPMSEESNSNQLGSNSRHADNCDY